MRGGVPHRVDPRRAGEAKEQGGNEAAEEQRGRALLRRVVPAEPLVNEGLQHDPERVQHKLRNAALGLDAHRQPSQELRSGWDPHARMSVKGIGEEEKAHDAHSRNRTPPIPRPTALSSVAASGFA